MKNLQPLQVLVNETFEITLKENRDHGEKWNFEYNLWAVHMVNNSYSIPKLRFRTTQWTRIVTFKVSKIGNYDIKCKKTDANGNDIEMFSLPINCQR